MTVVLKPTEAGNILLGAVQRFYAERKLCDVRIMVGNRVGSGNSYKNVSCSVVG
jgi:hypothetical protein